MSTLSVNEQISKLLQDNWALTAPSKTQINWLTSRSKVGAWINNQSQKYCIACYSGQSKNKLVSAKAWRFDKNVIIDILLKGASFDALVVLRETLAKHVNEIIQAHATSTPDVLLITPVSESKVELDVYVRQVITINCIYIEETT